MKCGKWFVILVLMLCGGCLQAHLEIKCSNMMVDCNLPQPPCPPGTEESGGIASTGMIYPSGCRTPEQKKEADDAFDEELCEGELGMAFFNPEYSVSHTCKWVNGEQEWTDTYEIKGVEVTKAEFERLYPIKCDPGWVQDGEWCKQESEEGDQ